ncbi:hypothetical protein C2869_09670 [Saccharobesus litoralis]|uniref:Uncharacterized protein n=1 Tax=Saccharobesus litoralis TaxID=2172099 RepID=A0A2S0VR42_9ALTE|nr:Druantia anti-phage system protein DruA [Saccharobesus litoralis]AWB66681.1 hypothetical protein C2869_09670 [Saccharobesus litoralis]
MQNTFQKTYQDDDTEGLSQNDLDCLRDKILRSHHEFRSSVKQGDKDYIRELHKYSKFKQDEKILSRLDTDYKKLSKYFICASKLEVARIKPRLINVDESNLFKRLFKLVRHSWSMPYSKGYGRRIRFIVWDDFHDSVIGIIGLQSPPADLKARDQLFDYPENQKLPLVNQTLDVYTLGAIPPYSNLLGGKLVAGLVGADAIRQVYWSKYAGKRSQINNVLVEQPLVGATTTSAFGRSSIYNRLKYQDRLLARPIGYTRGYGTIHLEPYFEELTGILKAHNIYHNGGYGKGPKPKWQNAVRALKILGLNSEYLQHGLGREVFLFEFFDDLKTGMSGGSFGRALLLDSEEYSQYWLERWAEPRAIRYPDWRCFDVNGYFLSCFTSNYSA